MAHNIVLSGRPAISGGPDGCCNVCVWTRIGLHTRIAGMKTERIGAGGGRRVGDG